jgi:hypothetical protein
MLLYVKFKLFFDDKSGKLGRSRYNAPLDEFTNYLFGGKDSFLDEKLRKSAALLRYFRDLQYPNYMEEPRETLSLLMLMNYGKKEKTT